MPEGTGRGPNLIRLGKLANSQQFDELEEAWLLVVEDGSLAVEDLIPIAGQVGRLGETGKAESLLWVLLSTVEERSGAERALDACRQAAAELPEGADLRRELQRLYLTVQEDYPDIELLLQRLCAAPVPLDEVVALVDAFLFRPPGTYVADHGHLEPGLVVAINGEMAVVTCRFGKRHQDYDAQEIGALMVLPSDHFPALLLYDPERLRELATSGPVDFVQLALQATKDRRLGYRELKGHVTLLLGEGGWTSWWKQAKGALKRAPLLDMSTGSQPTLRLRNRPRSYEQRLLEEFSALTDPLARLSLVATYLGETNGTAAETDAGTDLLVQLGNGAAKLAVAALAKNPAVALAGLAIHAEVAARGAPVARPNPRAAAQVLSRLEDPSLLAHLLPEALLQRTLAYLRRALPDRWPELWAAVLIRAGRRLCDTIIRTLLEANATEELQKSLAQILARPTGSPEAVCWLWRALQGSGLGQRLAAFPDVSAAVVLGSLLELADTSGRLHAVSKDETHRKTLDMVRQALLLQDGQPAKEVFGGASREEAARFKARIEQSAGLASAGRGQLLGLLRTTHEELFVEDLKPWEDDAIHTTETGLRKRQQEFDQILTEDIPAVAKQIGEAAAFGDLSENAEFTAALEKRDQLASRATAMENELQRAQVITREMATSPFVSVGTRVTARNLVSGQEEIYTFLGPWDTEPEHGILSYDAPLSLAFMGKKVGETVTFGEEDQLRWEVLSVEPAL